MKKGFTLIELLAVIVILGIIITLAVPKMMQLTKNKKQTLYEDNISELERLAASYIIDYPEVLRENPIYIPISALCDGKYIECPIIDPRDNSEITGNILVNEVNGKYVYSYNTDTLASVELTIDINGGEIFENQTGTYQPRQLITLNEPTKEGYVFAGWNKTSGNSILSGNTLIIGTTNTILTANWKQAIELTVNLDDGELTSNPEGIYAIGSIVNLDIPTKEGYDFIGWEVTIGNSILSGNTLIIGTTNTTLTANWKQLIELAVNLDGGKLTSNPEGIYASGSIVNLGIPTKANYDFVEWEVTIGNSILSGNTLIIGTDATTITATWNPNTYTITYDCNGGSGSTSNSTFTYESLSTISTSGCHKLTAGNSGNVYYVKGWAKTNNATEVLFTDGQIVTSSSEINSDTTLYAVWDELFNLVGNYEVIDDANGNWRVKIKGAIGQVSGNASITFNNDTNINVFLVGGGGGGYGYSGGGGGYTTTKTALINKNISYSISVGNGGNSNSNGETTTAFNFSINGGKAPSGAGGNGGSGGASISMLYAGSNGTTSNVAANGGDSRWTQGGIGQLSNTCEFGEGTYSSSGGSCNSGVSLYSGGGGGGSAWSSVPNGTPGGVGGGGAGGRLYYNVSSCPAISAYSGGNGLANTGGGGGGNSECCINSNCSSGNAGSGGSGIVVIRNAR